MRIAWIGTGVMGTPMAINLSDAGHEVVAYNRTHEKARALEPDIRAYSDLAACVKDRDVVFTMVGYPGDVEEVYETILAAASPQTILIDMTTSSPSLARTIYERAGKRNLFSLDAPVTGGDLGAREATLSIMVGGDEDVFKRALPLFEILGETVTYMGGAGMGQDMKLTNQTVIAGNIAGIAEALTYASQKGIDLDRALKVINGGSASSWQARINGRKMVDKDYKPGFYVKHFLKDLKLVLAEKKDLSLPVLERVTKAHEVLAENGFADLGTQSFIEYYLRKMA
ncbi:MAG: NAD(P)-dependent oxidoreductase [Acholeplasmataceae bacterium]